MSTRARNWLDFWGSANTIYVNVRHRDVHFRLIADQIAAYVPGSDAQVLDYGCGAALHADRVAAAARRLVLCDGVEKVRKDLAARYGGHPRISVKSPDEIAA